MFWNVADLGNKDFWVGLKGWDIIILSETWADKKGWAKVTGYLPRGYERYNCVEGTISEKEKQKRENNGRNGNGYKKGDGGERRGNKNE